MAEDERDDDATQAIPTSDESFDDTQYMTPDDEPTRVMPADDDATSVMPANDDATRRMDPGPDEATRQMRAPPADEPPPTRRITREDPMLAPPPTERIAYAEERNLSAWLIATVVVTALLIGGLVGYTQRKPSDANVVARALVSPDGGVVPFDGQGKLTVPRGALPTATAITIRRETVDHRVRLGPEGDPRSVVYEPGELVVYVFEPSTLRFQQPVTIELPRQGNGSAVLVDTKTGARVIPGEVVDGVVKIETTSFGFDS
jgi:hypothetical protein